MSPSLQYYFSQRVKHVFNDLYDLEANGDAVSLHDLRLELKKIRAITVFLRSIYPRQKLKKACGRLKSIFSEAGEIRELQLFHQWLEKQELTAFRSYFPEEELLTLAADFQQRTGDHKQVLKEAIEDIEQFVQATNQILAEQYVVDLYSQVIDRVRSRPGPGEWHGLRKLIKQWIYALNWLGQEERAKAETDLAYYKKLQEIIGYWHDAEMIRETLYRKKIYLSQDLEVQKSFARAIQKINQSLRYRERQVLEMLGKKEVAIAG